MRFLLGACCVRRPITGTSLLAEPSLCPHALPHTFPHMLPTHWRTQELNGFHTIRECVINFEFEDTNKVCGHRNERCCRRPSQSTVSQSALCRAAACLCGIQASLSALQQYH